MAKIEKEKMIAGELYLSMNPELVAIRRKCLELTDLFNNSSLDVDLRRGILRELLGACDENIYVEPTFKCDFGYNLRLGKRFYPR